LGEFYVERKNVAGGLFFEPDAVDIEADGFGAAVAGEELGAGRDDGGQHAHPGLLFRSGGATMSWAGG
jgi:hypothetical protein